MNLGKILAFTLPIIAGSTLVGGREAGGGGGGGQDSSGGGFLSGAANAFLQASGMREAKSGRPFTPATPRENRPTAALTRGNPMTQTATAGPVTKTTFESPLYKSALDGLLGRARNRDVQQLLAMYAQPVAPTKVVNRANTAVRLTEIKK
jgi:hypothetical protein